ncbi:MAG: 50S ribosomal protein L19 [Helicobacteraceae bacterium]|jgi:large subunit ribosomal protein L19|nr:50S ribosomal protein L19 [Helicobacteraceae bacterium]
MRNKFIEQFEQAQIADRKRPDFGAGDTIRLGIRIKEGEKTRVQIFEGVCIAKRGAGASKTITVRKIGANSIGVERIFPLYAEALESIEVVRKGKVRRAKLYYMRNLRGKAARIKEDRAGAKAE